MNCEKEMLGNIKHIFALNNGLVWILMIFYSVVVEEAGFASISKILLLFWNFSENTSTKICEKKECFLFSFRQIFFYIFKHFLYAGTDILYLHNFGVFFFCIIRHLFGHLLVNKRITQFSLNEKYSLLGSSLL